VRQGLLDLSLEERTIWCPAMSDRSHDATIRTFYDRALSTGKIHHVAIVASLFGGRRGPRRPSPSRASPQSWRPISPCWEQVRVHPRVVPNLPRLPTSRKQPRPTLPRTRPSCPDPPPKSPPPAAASKASRDALRVRPRSHRRRVRLERLTSRAATPPGSCSPRPLSSRAGSGRNTR
jgi:hypothetical protein